MVQDGSGVLWAEEKMVTNKAEVIDRDELCREGSYMSFLSGKPWGVFGGFSV